MSSGLPLAQGLYDPRNEHDACGVGFVVDLKGRASHRLVLDGITALVNLNHRGACGCEDNTGDGAGILIQIPHEFFKERCTAIGVDLPEPGHYGVGAFFTAPDPAQRDFGMKLFERIVAEEEQVFLGWRPLKTDHSSLGESARAVEPVLYHALIGRGPRIDDDDRFERKLFVVRKRFETEIEHSGLCDHKYFYFSSLSCRTLVYKGMLTPEQVPLYFADDLHDEKLASALCLFHSRFSTNTFPSWELAHPYRMLSHNGEINTLRGNINWMRAREALFASDLYEPGDVEKLLPIIREGLSDTACLDNAVELLVRSGYSLPHAMMMLIPEAWEGHETMSQVKKDFYAYHSCLMEAWDGPASIGFTDGRTIGAVLDRNGLRPSRYIVTKDGMVLMASEVGALNIPPEDIVLKGRLEPGKMFLVDLEEGRIVDDEELKHRIATEKPYGKWLREFMVPLAEVPAAGPVPGPDHFTLLHRQQAFGYTLEDMKFILGPMGNQGEESLGSMGTDTPLAVLSDRAQSLFNYFKQLFAQVTNPPLDAIREELVTSVLTGAGGEGNLLMPTPESCRQIALDMPVIDNDELAKLKQLDGWRGFKSVLLPILFPAAEGALGMERALDAMFGRAVEAIEGGANLLILSDRGVDSTWAPIPSLLATAGLHHHLVRKGMRTRAGLIVECGDARENHHFALLLGYGAGTINPYVAFETLDDMIQQGMIDSRIGHAEAVYRYRKAIKKGVVKVMSKMGISTIQSYRGAQIFEAIGLNKEFIEKYFEKTASRIGGVGLEEIARETLAHHRRAYSDREVGPPILDEGGQYQWRRDGEYHLFNPETVYKLQHATQSGRYDLFRAYTRLVNEQSTRLCTLRGLFAFKTEGRSPVPLEEVEPVEAIVRRFATGAMSYGSISGEAHETLAIAMNRIGGKSNTGEGGEDPTRFQSLPSGDSKRSAIK
ncbi:MAG: hypothetical protein NVSMB9_05230 [Isosphaeraceae bacterium]